MIYLVAAISIAIGFIAGLLWSSNTLESCRQLLKTAKAEHDQANTILKNALDVKGDTVKMIKKFRDELEET